MITRGFTALITDPQGDLLATGTLEVTPSTRSQVLADPDAIVMGTQVYAVTAGALDVAATIQAPGQYVFEIKDAAGLTIVAFRGGVDDDFATPISLQEIAQTTINLARYLEGTNILATGATDGSPLTAVGGVGVWPANNFAAVVAPTITDDVGSGYQKGSWWIDTVGAVAYICLNPAAGAAVWFAV